MIFISKKMNCIITLKINDYFPKIDSIPYENFVCLFTYGDFFGKIPFIKKSNNICKHELDTISSDIKYNIRILEFNESSLIGICEMIIPFAKIRKINPPGTMIQEQKIKLIIDVNTKRKLFGKLINTGEIYLDLRAEVFIPDKKNILFINDINDINSINNIKKINNANKKIHVRTQNKTNSNNLDGTPRTIKKKRMIMEIKSNREIIQKDNSSDQINKYGNNSNDNYKANKNKTINVDIVNDEKNNTGMFRNKIKLDNNNQIKIIDFRNKNDNLYNQNNEINLTKDAKKIKLNKKKSPKKKVTILELMEQKMQSHINTTNSNTNSNNANNNIRSNTYYNNVSNLIQNSANKKSHKGSKKIINSKNNDNENNNNNFINNNNSSTNKNTLKRINKKEEKSNLNSNKNSIINSPAIIIISPNPNISSPNTINTNKVKRNNSKGINKINKKNNNKLNIYNYNTLNETETNKNNGLIKKNKRNSSQEAINRNKNTENNYKEKDNNICNINNKKDSFKLGKNKRPKIDTSEDMIQRRSYNNKLVKDYSNTNNDLNSNNGLLSTEERTEQGLSEIDKIILEKGTELRDKFQNQINYNYSYNKELNNSKSNNNKNEKIRNYHSKNNLNAEKLYYDIGDNQIIGGANYTIETPKTNKDFDNTNIALDNKTSFSSSTQSLSHCFTQEELRNNYIELINLYYLLNQKLSKTIYENNDLYKKILIIRENFNNEIKKEEIIKYRNENNKYNSYIAVNIKQSLNDKILEKLTYIKSLESRLYQDIFGYTYDDYEIIRTKEIERVNKLNDERKLKLLLKVLESIINDCGNVSQIFNDNKTKENMLKEILNKYNIKEKEKGEENYIDLKSFNLSNGINYYNYRKYQNILDEDDIFENKVIREVDEDKEEEESIYSASNNKKNIYFTNGVNDSQNIDSVRQSLIKSQIEQKEKDKEKDVDNISKQKNINIKENEKKEIKENDKNNLIKSNKNNEIENEEEKKKIESMKDILTNKFREKYGKNKIFKHIKKNEFIFDDKYSVFADLNSSNNEIIVEIENNKYKLDEFVSIYCKDENKNENNDIIKIDKEKFVYKRKRGKIQNRINSEIKQGKEKEKEEMKKEKEKEEKENEKEKKEKEEMEKEKEEKEKEEKEKEKKEKEEREKKEKEEEMEKEKENKINENKEKEEVNENKEKEEEKEKEKENNEHQKKRRKRRIIDDDSDEEENKD